MFKQLTTSRMCPKSQKIRINHKNTSKIRVFFLKYSYIRVSSYKYERLIHTGIRLRVGTFDKIKSTYHAALMRAGRVDHKFVGFGDSLTLKVEAVR